MGVTFLHHPNGNHIYSCKECDAPLTNKDEIFSKRFTGSTGRAFLFNRVVNVVHSDSNCRVMLTGRHIVLDVYCKKCDTKLGWMYEFAVNNDQQYKEGKTILEVALIQERPERTVVHRDFRELMRNHRTMAFMYDPNSEQA
ncbi:unnamed protein product [Oikopleura dioica]|uniref:Protein yippee-like n=1 Tax=Oikopleura dioica TaxID=34765 RepID=E4Y381_OIKDI|nr:unnamed protein product [Oikopleura dioica]